MSVHSVDSIDRSVHKTNECHELSLPLDDVRIRHDVPAAVEDDTGPEPALPWICTTCGDTFCTTRTNCCCTPLDGCIMLTDPAWPVTTAAGPLCPQPAIAVSPTRAIAARRLPRSVCIPQCSLPAPALSSAPGRLCEGRRTAWGVPRRDVRKPTTDVSAAGTIDGVLHLNPRSLDYGAVAWLWIKTEMSALRERLPPAA